MLHINKRVARDKLKWHISHYERNGYTLVDVKTSPNGVVKGAYFEKRDENGEVTEKLLLEPKPRVRYSGSHGWSNLKQVNKKDGD